MAKFKHEFTVEGEEHLCRLKPRPRTDLFLFYKECLVNISRHSGASGAHTQLTATPNEIQLSIHDNGRGMIDGTPKSLKRRAKLLGAQLRIESALDSGTLVQINLRLRRIEDHTNRTKPDVILLDISLPGMSGIDATIWLKKYAPNTKILILSQSDKEADVYEAIFNGADGYLLKSSTVHQIKDAIRSVMKGGSPLDANVASYILETMKTKRPTANSNISLSNRELETLTLMAEGLSKKEIAQRLGISPTTVVTHVGHIYQKLNAANAPSAVSKAYQSGILPVQR